MNAPLARQPRVRLITITHATVWRIACVTIFVTLLIGCAPLEVRVSNAGSQAPEQSVAGQHEPAEQEAESAVDPAAESVFATIVGYLALFAELCAAFAVSFGIIRALVQFCWFILQRNRGDGPQDNIRLQLGRTLALALEFALAADILQTAIAPTWDIIAQVAAIIVLRTVLNYFLEREIRQVEERSAGTHVEEPVVR